MNAALGAANRRQPAQDRTAATPEAPARKVR